MSEHDERDEYGDLPISSEFVSKLNSITDDEAENRAAALRAGLEDFELEGDDLAVLDAEWDWRDGPVMLPALPVLAIVGLSLIHI